MLCSFPADSSFLSFRLSISEFKVRYNNGTETFNIHVVIKDLGGQEEVAALREAAVKTFFLLLIGHTVEAV
jgi:hypothetical protein